MSITYSDYSTSVPSFSVVSTLSDLMQLPSKEIVFIDSAVPEHEELEQGVLPGHKVYTLLSEKDAITQITAVLQRRQDVRAVHIVSHGSPGCLHFGEQKIDAETIDRYRAQLETWFRTSADLSAINIEEEISATRPSLLLYGCSVAAGGAGTALLTKLQQWTGAAIVASCTPTGDVEAGGDWILGKRLGTVTAEGAFSSEAMRTYRHLLVRPFHTVAVSSTPAELVQIGADIDGEAAGDNSGRSVSLSADGSVVAIGARYNDGNGTDSGHVRLFERTGDSWTQIGSDIDGEAAGDIFGRSVSLSADGSVVAIGAVYNDGNGTNSGHVRLFERTGDSWTQIGSDIDGEAAYDYSGVSVSLSADGSVVAIGAPFNDGNDTDSGHVRLFERTGDSWTQIGSDIDGEAADDNSGYSVSLSADGSVAAIGADRNDGNGNDSGHVRLFERTGDSWTQIGSDIDGESIYNYSGYSVSLSADGSVVAIGARDNDGNAAESGHVRLFERTGSSWTQIGSDIDGEAATDHSGYSVSLSADGSVVAIGAPFNDRNGTGSGHVRLYKRTGNSWTQIGSDIDGEAADDNSGYSVSLSADGSVVAIGALYNDGNGTDSGHVRLYSVPTPAPVVVAEDQARSLSGISVSDGDGDLSTTQLSVENGTLFVVDLTGGATLSAGSNHTATLTLSGTAEQINAALATLIYQGSRNFNGTDTLTLTSTDTANITTTDTLAINVTPVEDVLTHTIAISSAPAELIQIGADIAGESIYDYSGNSVSLSADGSVVAIGAALSDENGDNSGHVRLFERTGNSWTQIGEDIAGEVTGDLFGNSVSLSADGSVVAISAISNDGNGTDSGHVRLYERTGNGWTQIGTDINGEAAYDYSGNSVSLSADGSVVAIGAGGNDGNGADSGHVRLYKRTDNDWTQIGADIDGEVVGDFSGQSVSLSADGLVVAIGASTNDGYGIAKGHVRLFERTGDSWVQIGEAINGEAAYDNSGNAVSLSADGSVVAIGAALSDENGDNSGHVRLYKRTGNSWTQIGEDIAGDAVSDQFGSSVSLSADGSVVAIGATLSDENGDNSGHIQLYKRTGDSWTQIGEAIGGDVAGDQFGSSVSLSADGSVVAIGATHNDGNGESSGHVRLYSVSSPNPTVTEDALLSLAGIRVNDGDGDLSTTQLSVANGTLSVDRYLSGGVTLSDGNNSSATLTLSGTATEINATLATLTYQGDLNFNGTDTLTITSTDVANATITDTLSIDVTSDNDAPTHTIAVPSSAPVELVQIGVDIDGEAASDLSGQSVSLSADGSVVAISATRNDGNGNDSGHVRLFERTDGGWVQIGADIDGEATGDESGTSISLSANGSIVAIGARYNDENGNASGHVRLYERTGNSWTQIGGDIDGEAAGDEFGFSVSLSADGSVVAIGAANNDGSGNASGHVRLYERTNGGWVQIGNDIDGEAAGDSSGYSVSLSADGSVVAIGAGGNDGNGSGSGHVRLYERTGNSWVQIGADIDGEAAGDLSGRVVSLSADGSVVAIGATRNDENGLESGHVRLYERTGSSWVQIGDDINGEAPGDESGFSISLSADGSVVAIGAIRNDENGLDSGHVRLYKRTGDSWVQVDTDINGEAGGDLSGYSVSLSADGSMVAIGAINNDGNGDNSGNVRLYSLSSPGPTVVEDETLSLSGISVSDGDGDLSTTQLSVANGSLSVDLSGGVTISAGSNNTKTLTLSGTETQINAALDTLTYQGDRDFNGTDTLTLTSTDTTSATNTNTLTINVTPTNDVPTNASLAGYWNFETGATSADLERLTQQQRQQITINGIEGTAQVFTEAELLADFTDVDNDQLSVADLTISNGELVDNGDRTYTFTPTPDFNGTATLRYNVVDGRSGSAAMVKLVAIAPNEAPTGSVTITGTAELGQTLTASNSIADADGLGNIAYTWLANGVSTGITGDSYTLTQADIGRVFTVEASYTDDLGKVETLTSLQTATVIDIDDTSNGDLTFTKLVADIVAAGVDIPDSDALTAYLKDNLDTLLQAPRLESVNKGDDKVRVSFQNTVNTSDLLALNPDLQEIGIALGIADNLSSDDNPQLEIINITSDLSKAQPVFEPIFTSVTDEDLLNILNGDGDRNGVNDGIDFSKLPFSSAAEIVASSVLVNLPPLHLQLGTDTTDFTTEPRIELLYPRIELRTLLESVPGLNQMLPSIETVLPLPNISINTAGLTITGLTSDEPSYSLDVENIPIGELLTWLKDSAISLLDEAVSRPLDALLDQASALSGLEGVGLNLTFSPDRVGIVIAGGLDLAQIFNDIADAIGVTSPFDDDASFTISNPGFAVPKPTNAEERDFEFKVDLPFSEITNLVDDLGAPDFITNIYSSISDIGLTLSSNEMEVAALDDIALRPLIDEVAKGLGLPSLSGTDPYAVKGTLVRASGLSNLLEGNTDNTEEEPLRFEAIFQSLPLNIVTDVLTDLSGSVGLPPSIDGVLEQTLESAGDALTGFGFSLATDGVTIHYTDTLSFALDLASFLPAPVPAFLSDIVREMTVLATGSEALEFDIYKTKFFVGQNEKLDGSDEEVLEVSLSSSVDVGQVEGVEVATTFQEGGGVELDINFSNAVDEAADKLLDFASIIPGVDFLEAIEIANPRVRFLTQGREDVDENLGEIELVAGINLSGSIDIAKIAENNPDYAFFDYLSDSETGLGVENIGALVSIGQEKLSLTGIIAGAMPVFSASRLGITDPDHLLSQLYIELNQAELKLGYEDEDVSLGLGGLYSVSGYDPTQDNEPVLRLTGELDVTVDSLSGGASTKPLNEDEVWINPFGVSDTKITALGFELGATYKKPYVNSLGLAGVLEFEDGRNNIFDFDFGLSLNIDEPLDNAIFLTVKKAVPLSSLLAGGAIGFLQAATALSPETDAFSQLIELIDNVIDGDIVSVDSDDDDLELDPLIQFATEEIDIAGITFPAGYGINGEITFNRDSKSGAKRARLSVNAPEELSKLSGFLLIDGFSFLDGVIEVSGVGNPNTPEGEAAELNLEISVDSQDPTAAFMKGDAAVKITGFEVAAAQFDVNKDNVNIEGYITVPDVVTLNVDIEGGRETDAFTGAGQLTLFDRFQIASADVYADASTFNASGAVDMLGATGVDLDVLFEKGALSFSGSGDAKLMGSTIDLSVSGGYDNGQSVLNLSGDVDAGIGPLDVRGELNAAVNNTQTDINAALSVSLFGSDYRTTGVNFEGQLDKFNFDSNLDFGPVKFDANVQVDNKDVDVTAAGEISLFGRSLGQGSVRQLAPGESVNILGREVRADNALKLELAGGSSSGIVSAGFNFNGILSENMYKFGGDFDLYVNVNTSVLGKPIEKLVKIGTAASFDVDLDSREVFFNTLSPTVVYASVGGVGFSTWLPKFSFRLNANNSFNSILDTIGNQVVDAVKSSARSKIPSPAKVVKSAGKTIKKTWGRVFNSPIDRATVWLDTDSDGILGIDEFRGLTDEGGNFVLTMPEEFDASVGVLRSTGGIDTATGLAFRNVQTAFIGSAITPLTSLIVSLSQDDDSVDTSVAQAEIRSAFNIDESIDLETFNHFAEAFSGNSLAREVLLAVGTVQDVAANLQSYLAGAIGVSADEITPLTNSRFSQGIYSGIAKRIADNELDLEDAKQIAEIAQDVVTSVEESVAESGEASPFDNAAINTTLTQAAQAIAAGATRTRLLGSATTDVLETLKVVTKSKFFNQSDQSEALNQVGQGTLSGNELVNNFADTSEAALTTIQNIDLRPQVGVIDNFELVEGIQTITEIPFRVYDFETPSDSLEISLTSSNSALVAVEDIVISQSENAHERLLSVTPTAGETGSSTITLTVTDGSNNIVEREFIVTVLADNAPVFSPVADVSLAPNATAGQTVIDIDAADGDSSELDSNVVYRIIDGNANHDGDTQDPFEIDFLTGELKVNDPDDFITGSGQKEFSLIVQADDGFNTNEVNVAITIKDSINGLDGDDLLRGNRNSNILNGMDGNDKLYGGAGNDELFGGNGNDRLYGQLGDDILIGGTGNDFYSIDSQGDAVVEAVDEGFDRVLTRVDLVLTENVEYLRLAEGTTATEGIGNAIDNRLIGNSNNNRLNGMDGNDRLDGGDGNDELLGGDGNDRLFGQSGDDTLIGGAGDDFYSVDSSGDVVVEAVDEGFDQVLTQVDLVLTENVEYLRLAEGTTATEGTGNAVNNRLVGNSNNNRLNGMDGNDRLDGGAGNDELFGGNGNDRLDGGAGNDELFGGNGNDRLYGQLGDDILIGGTGNDFYSIDSQGDAVVEAVDEGFDRVLTRVDLVLTENVEYLRLAEGTTATEGIGNAIDNRLIGNSNNNRLNGMDGNDRLDGGDGNDELLGGDGNDRLFGQSGDDTLIGGAGRDILVGGAGSDTFTFNFEDEQTDVVRDFNASEDTLNLTGLFLGYEGDDLIADRYLRFGVSGKNTFIQVDVDGASTNRELRNLAMLNNFTDISSLQVGSNVLV